MERRFSAIWGGALLTECVARFLGAFTIPVETVAWLSTVLLLGAIATAVVVGGTASGPIDAMVEAEAAAVDMRLRHGHIMLTAGTPPGTGSPPAGPCPSG